MNDKIGSVEEFFGPPISVYTRAQAIEDGILVDVTREAAEAGFKWPVALTRTAYERYVEVPVDMKGEQDTRGRLWDILQMLWVAVRTKSLQGASGEFRVLVRLPASEGWQSNETRNAEGDGLRLVRLKAIAGPGDDGSPCITIMLPDED